MKSLLIAWNLIHYWWIESPVTEATQHAQKFGPHWEIWYWAMSCIPNTQLHHTTLATISSQGHEVATNRQLLLYNIHTLTVQSANTSRHICRRVTKQSKLSNNRCNPQSTITTSLKVSNSKIYTHKQIHTCTHPGKSQIQGVLWWYSQQPFQAWLPVQGEVVPPACSPG